MVMVKYSSIFNLIILLFLAGCKRTGSEVSDSNQTGRTPTNQSRQTQDLEKEIVVDGPNELEFELVYIKPGSFTIGRGTKISRLFSIIRIGESSGTNEGPPRKVTITKGFYIGKYKVTVGQYCEFLNSPDVNQPENFISFNKCTRILMQDGRYVPRPGTKDCTINTVPWDGANEFCKWLSKKTGRRFRLPTEAEWEFTARGPEGRRFPWGDKEPSLVSVTEDKEDQELWMGPSVYSIAEKFPANVTPEGVVGMAGGEGEWVSDYYADRYPNKDEIDPTGPKECKWPSFDPEPYRVLRRAVFSLTERAPGLDANQGGAYGFRILMEVGEDQSKQKKLK
jgi:formylglycine-generating enzyme required for sulfatase activity